ncbi:uncharacterized protein G2W53_014895 [Senna tora]|uniref:Uncharacterized protein n=1 Tax=Senna tora TaxID=362788 RepID=A0A835C8W6_9FABA|nr:uncharacterized protein G2W53_014895 [Senna tora]
MATGQISRRRRLIASDLLAPSSCCSRSCQRKRRSASGEFLSCAVSLDVVDEKDYGLLLKENLYFKNFEIAIVLSNVENQQ